MHDIVSQEISSRLPPQRVSVYDQQPAAGSVVGSRPKYESSRLESLAAGGRYPGRAAEVVTVAGDYAFELFPEFASRVSSVQEGVLPSQDIEKLIRAGRIHAVEPIEPRQIQPASLDLRLGSVAYRLQASFLPGRKSTVRRKLEGLAMAELDLTRATVLEKRCVYLAPLMEQLRLPEELEAKANPKSTTGRLDVFTRLITDY
ncbi:MAG: 2'-deoxycytidine 5'-triphosphate deaminase [Acidobacteria bacterium]|nr:2'-deoxycytidine 5'-triphosphate deaminase [Acidobacteriota bacterium]